VISERLREVIDGLDIQTDLWWLATVLSGLVCAMLGAFAFPESGLFWAYLSVLLRLSFAACLAQQAWGTVFARLLPLGLAVGIFSIFPDYLLTQGFRAAQRVYPATEARLLASPLYVPLAWACAVVELGYVALRVGGIMTKRWPGQTGQGLAMLASGATAAVSAACLEVLAVKARWWSYRPGQSVIEDAMALHVVAAHFFVFLGFLPVFSRYAACGGTRLYATIRYGAVFAGLIFGSVLMAYALFEGLRP
jgi:hypothetical protein